MTIDELDRLQRDVEDFILGRCSRGRGEVTAVDELVVLFQRLVGVARKDLARGSEVEPRLSTGLRTLAMMLREPAADGPQGGPRDVHH